MTFRLGDTTKYSRGFEMLATRAKDLTVPLTEIGVRLIRSIGVQFATEGAWAGSPWRPLTDKYAAWKEQHYPGRPILVASGAMRSSMLNPGRGLRILPTRLLYSPESDVAIYHQEGTDRMVARPMVELPLVELHEFDRIFVRWLRGLERGPMWGLR